MKKIKCLLLIAIICFFVTPSESKAACGVPPSPKQIILHDYYGTEFLIKGESYNFYFVIYKNDGCPNVTLENYINYDEKIFSFEEFDSNFDFEYNDNKIKFVGDKNSIKSSNDYSGTIDVEPDSFVTLYRIKLKVKEDAKLGETKVNNQLYNILCSDGGTKCEEKPNTPSQEDNSDIKEEENNNNINDKVILDDTKFYVLAGLLGTVIIEMFVLILKKTKKS